MNVMIKKLYKRNFIAGTLIPLSNSYLHCCNGTKDYIEKNTQRKKYKKYKTLCVGQIHQSVVQQEAN